MPAKKKVTVAVVEEIPEKKGPSAEEIAEWKQAVWHGCPADANFKDYTGYEMMVASFVAETIEFAQTIQTES